MILRTLMLSLQAVLLSPLEINHPTMDLVKNSRVFHLIDAYQNILTIINIINLDQNTRHNHIYFAILWKEIRAIQLHRLLYFEMNRYCWCIAVLLSLDLLVFGYQQAFWQWSNHLQIPNIWSYHHQILIILFFGYHTSVAHSKLWKYLASFDPISK